MICNQERDLVHMFRRTKWFTRESSLRLSSLVLQDKTSCNKIGCKTRLIYRLPNVYSCMFNAILKPVKERNLEHPLRCLMLILVEMLLYNGYKLMHRTERRDNTGGHCDNCQHGTPASRSSREKLHLLLIHSCPQPPPPFWHMLVRAQNEDDGVISIISSLQWQTLLLFMWSKWKLPRSPVWKEVVPLTWKAQQVKRTPSVRMSARCHCYWNSTKDSWIKRGGPASS